MRVLRVSTCILIDSLGDRRSNLCGDYHVFLSAHHLQTPSSKLFLRKVTDAFHIKSGHLPIGCQHNTYLKGPLLKCLKIRDGLRQRNIPFGA